LFGFIGGAIRGSMGEGVINKYIFMRTYSRVYSSALACDDKIAVPVR